ncbi:N-6 DNA methylase [Microbacterium aurantiacum]|uniref:N-6 DNA methylase n=1 Tax=Microbacterium aurantiacum TaxID=162393 RepID=UPI003D7211AA
MIDQHFSPPTLAARLANYLDDDPSGVFDPAMGEGALLQAVKLRWPGVRVYGADVDHDVVVAARRRYPTWNVARADALDPASRRASRVWRAVRSEGVDYVVLNPPFSFRGYGGPKVTLDDEEFRATPSVAFLVTALTQSVPRKGALAILPAGALPGQRDRTLMRRLSEMWDLDTLEELPRGTFQGVAASSVIVRATPRTNRPLQALDTKREPRRQMCVCVDVIRGRVPVANADLTDDAAGVPWIHTTSVRGGRVDLSASSSRRSQSSTGPLVVLPRVGRFDLQKIALVGPSQVLLSDCMFGLRPLGTSTRDLAVAIARSGEALGRSYLGTGAPHMTIGRLVEFLDELGYAARHVPAGAASSPCSCGAPQPVAHSMPLLVASG